MMALWGASGVHTFSPLSICDVMQPSISSGVYFSAILLISLTFSPPPQPSS
jgi:hypothetical protein